MNDSHDNRIVGFDLLKIFALLIVVNSHFVANYIPGLSEVNVLGNVLDNFSGKFGVIIFALLAGLFSFRSGRKKELGDYLIKRYLFFFSCCFVCDLSFFLLNVNMARENSTVGMVVSQCVFLGDYYCDTLWFIKDFLIGSFLCFVAGKYHFSYFIHVLSVLLLFYFGKPFIGAYFAGCLLDDILVRFSFFKSHIGRMMLLCFVFVFLLFRREESNLVYFEDLLRGMALVLFVMSFSIRFTENYSRVIQWLSSLSMAVIIAHNLSFFFFDQLPLLNKMSVFPKYVLWFLLTLALAMVYNILIRLLYSFLLKLLDWINKNDRKLAIIKTYVERIVVPV